MTTGIAVGVLGAVVAALAGSAAAATSDAAASLVELRLQVDALAATLHDRRTSIADELGALRAERAELQRQVRLARTRNTALRRVERDRADQDEDRKAKIDRWNAPALAAVQAARDHVERTLPFNRAARLAVLDELAAELTSSHPDAARAMERLWRFVEEETSMAAEVGLSRQVVQLEGGEPQLVDVLRFSMALLYVRTLDGAFAWAVHTDGGWSFERLEDPRSVAIVRASFEAHERNEGFGLTHLLVPPSADLERASDAVR